MINLVVNLSHNIDFGVGLRAEHFTYLEENEAKGVDVFEIISENFMFTQGRPRKILEALSQKHQLSFHGVSLNLAGDELPKPKYLKNLKNLINEFRPRLVSDHLCWTGTSKANLHNLLPVPYNKESLVFLCERIDYVQNFLKRPILIENLSAYFDYNASDFSEWDFLIELASSSGCGLLLDLNNVYVNAHNHGFDAFEYVDSIPAQLIGEIHLAGHEKREGFLFDSHSDHVCEEVWSLLKRISHKLSETLVMIEWDENIPDFELLTKEMLKAKSYLQGTNEQLRV